MSIILTKIKKSLGYQLIINKVSLEIFDGELFVLLGSSGSGKSTLLRIIAGLIQPDSGKIEINKRDVTYLSPQERNTGFVFQNYSVFRHMTVKENIEFGLKIRKVTPPEKEKISGELLDLVGLTGLEKRYADQLSGGQQQRVSLARALAYQPSVLLLDEPFGALDVKIRSQLRKSLKEIQKKIKVTTILVTHDQEEAFELADRIGVINQGQLIEVDKPDILYNYPKFEFTAAFIGDGNVLVGKKEKDIIKLGTLSIPFPENSPPHDDNAPVRVLFKAEKLILSNTKLPDDIFTLGKAKVNETRFNGSYFRVFLEMNELTGVQSIEPNISFREVKIIIQAVLSGKEIDDQIKVGSELWIGITDYHILQPSGLKLLIYDEDHSKVSEFGLTLAKITGGFASLLSVVDSQSQTSEALSVLEKIRQAHQKYLNLTSAQVRVGKQNDELLKEAQEGRYEIVVLSWEEKAYALQILKVLKLPVILVTKPHLRLQKILVCTAAGEPGKEDIKFACRVAKLSGSSVTLFHAMQTRHSKDEAERANRHLASGKSYIETMGVPCEIKIIEANNPVEKIEKELNETDYDLLVIGSPAPRSIHDFFWKDITSKIIDVSNIPVLIVPMQA
ncbi:MAG TPA: ATP-binding cassette domain-containing protein [Ignavibacteriaceae bacterium]|nr:ATP-binding cassette domain-containing protein [Ignavibacteriaceae bacterium]